MKLIYTHENLAIVKLLASRLEQEGIDVCIKNEFLSGGIGELPAIASWPEIWVVHDDDEDRARVMIQEIHQHSQADQQQAAWICAKCGEDNEGQFDLCWSCQAARQ